eukprot:4272986-Pleurochrysis_carterae.AAC.1
MDFKALDFQGWKRWATLAIFKGRDGLVRFTDGRSPALRRPADGGVDVALYTRPPSAARLRCGQKGC